MTTGIRTLMWLRGFAGIGMVLSLAACSAAGQPSSAPTASSTATPPASVGQPSASVSATPASPSPLATGMDQASGIVLGDGPLPTYTVAVPHGWLATGDGHFVTHSGDGVVIGFGVWEVMTVPTDPCHWKAHLVDPGPTVDDLVRALLAQATRHATKPTDVTLAGYAGKYLEWSVPTGLVVTGDADFKGCDIQDNGHLDFVSWMSYGGGERYQQVAGQIDQLWVLDVNGQRLVVDATHSSNAPAALKAELATMIQSIRFVLP